jgi:hypothetical protein
VVWAFNLALAEITLMSIPKILSKIADSSTRAVMRLRVRSALNPTLWLCGIVTVPAILIALFAPQPLQVPLIVLAFVPVGFFAVSELYLVFKDPDKLQSEEYQIQKRALKLIEHKGSVIPIEATSIEAISKPEFRFLTDAKLDAGSEKEAS